MPSVSKSLRITGAGQFTGSRAKSAEMRLSSEVDDPTTIVKEVSTLTDSKFTLTPSARKEAIKIVRKELKVGDSEARKIVNLVVQHTRKTGGSFWDTLLNIGKNIVGAIPFVGSAVKEGITSLQTHKPYNFKRAALDTGLSLLPGGLGTVAKGALSLSGLDKKITGGCRYVPGTDITVMEDSSMVGGRCRMTAEQLAERTGVSVPEAQTYLESGNPKKRERSPKQKSRDALIRKIMQMYPGTTLPQASAFIRENNLKY